MGGMLDLDLARELARETLDGLLTDGRPGPGYMVCWHRVGADGADEGEDAWLYHGTAGVGLTLALGHEVLGEKRWLEGARRAARWLLSRRSGAREPLTGLWLGEAGAVTLLLRLARITGDAGWVELAADRATWAAAQPQRWTELLYGAAGLGLALLQVFEGTRDRAWLDRAREQGEVLARSAQRTPDGVRWTWPGRDAVFVGLAHGAAGIAPFLLELAARLPEEPRWRALADDALRWVAARELEDGRWPALDGAVEDEVAVQWCHGAPGVAIAFARAYARTGDRAHLAVAERAARATVAAGDVRENPSLCHGLAGNAEAPLELWRVTKDAAWRDAARLLLADLPTYVTRDDGVARWASDDPGVRRPGLATGSAGVAYALLRLLDVERVGSPFVAIG